MEGRSRSYLKCGCAKAMHETLQISSSLCPLSKNHVAINEGYVTTSKLLVKICSHSLLLSFLRNDLRKWVRKGSIRRFEPFLLFELWGIQSVPSHS